MDLKDIKVQVIEPEAVPAGSVIVATTQERNVSMEKARAIDAQLRFFFPQCKIIILRKGEQIRVMHPPKPPVPAGAQS